MILSLESGLMLGVALLHLTPQSYSATSAIADGMALDSVLFSAPMNAGAAGGGVFLGIFLRKPLDALSIATLMASQGWSSSEGWIASFSFALFCLLVAFIFAVGAAPSHALEVWSPETLAFPADALI